MVSLQATSIALILASASSARAEMLQAAGLLFEQVPSQLDEAAIRDALPDASPITVAARLAHDKALAVSTRFREAYVIGCDQVLDFNGHIMDKPGNRQRARDQLLALRNGKHSLHSAVCVAHKGDVIWATTGSAHIGFRNYSSDFIERYLDAAGEDILHCVGACQIEALGIHLFDSVDGDYFTILGMPLLPLIRYLREIGIVAD